MSARRSSVRWKRRASQCRRACRRRPSRRCVIGVLHLQSRLAQLLLQASIPPGVKQLLKYTATLLRLGKQQTQKIPLRQHGDLAKLIVIQPKQGGDFVIHFRLFGNHPAIRTDQLRHSVLGSHALTPGLGPPVLGTAAHGVYRPIVCKSQLCKGGSLRRCVLGAQCGWFPLRLFPRLRRVQFRN